MGRNIEQSVVIKADVQTTLSGMNEVVNKLNQGLREGATKVDLTKGIGLSLSKQIDKYKTELGKFSELTKGNKVEFADAGNAIKSGENLIKIFREIKRVVGDFDNLSVFDAKKIFPDAFDTKVSDLLSSLSNLEASLTRLNQKQISLQTARDEIASLEKDAEAFKGLMDQEATVKINLDEAKETLKAVEDEIDRLRQQASEGIELKIEAARKESGKAMLDQQQIWRELNKKGVNEADFSGSTVNATKFKGKSATAWEKQASKKDGSEASKAEAKAALEAIRIYNQEKAVLIELSRVINDRDNEIKELTTSLSKISKMSLPEAMRISSDSTDDIKIANDLLEAHKQAQEEVAEAEAKYALAQGHAKGAAKAYKETTTAIEVQQSKIEKLTTEIGELEREVGNVSLEKAFSAAGVKDFSVEMLKSKEGVNELKIKLQQLDEEKLTTLKKELKDMGLNTEIVEEALDGVRGVIKQVDDGADDIKKTAQEIENLKGQVLGFFSLTNSVELFKRAVRGAMETVKELDKTMTEAAVVTEFSVSDMWDKLPVYSDEAQKLGVSINSMYQATTLYYQQGLKTNEAMALGVETMKMAKIAAMDSTEATKAMTSALRGFNMELNETSATKVNDVYSQLAAVTAADTAQIATAMEKTASIAASANMEFETTAALLAQIIETTQEAPETAGTAMKTIIARFSEVKALKDQGETTGKDSEGEVIDVNKIQTALRTVGISMDNFFEGTEGLDSVLLRLAEKWDTLDFKTQRYIATTAAGSRQQSRFIAMMSDYARTTELVGEAQNSAGASQRQFQKTQDSMEAKIQRLENAWNQFLMGLANNEILKGAVDALTFIIENINSLTEALSGGHGLIKSIISLVTVISGLKIGKDVFGKVLGWAGSQFIGQSEAGKKLDLTGLVAPKESGQKAGKIYSEELVKAAANGIKSKRNKLSSFVNKLFPNKEKTEKDSEKEQKTAIKPDTSEITETAEEMEKAGKKMDKAGKDADELKTSTENATSSIGNMGEAAQQAGQKAEGAGEKIEEAGEEAEKTNTKTQGLVKGMQAAGVAMVVAGSAASLLSSYFESLGMEEAAEQAAVISNVLTGLGSLLAILPGAIKGLETAAAALGVSSVAAFGAIAAVVAVVAGLVYLLSKGLEEASGTAQLEKMNEQLQNLTTNADDAKKRLEEMVAAKEKLNSMNQTFDDLTRGTREWKQAIVENNQQILELINTYSQLSKFVSTGINGELVIKEEGWEEVINQQQQAYMNALGAKTAMAQQVQQTELKFQTEQYMSKTMDGKGGLIMDSAQFRSGIRKAIGLGFLEDVYDKGALPSLLVGGGSPKSVEKQQTGGLTYDQFMDFAALAAERGYTVTEKENGEISVEDPTELLRELRINLGDSTDEFLSTLKMLGNSFNELSSEALAVKIAEEARVDAIAATIAQSTEEVQNSKFGNIAEEITAQSFGDYTDNINKEADLILKENLSDLKGEDAEKILSEYAEYQGIDKSEARRQLEEKEITKESIAKTVASARENASFAKAMKNATTVMNDISQNKTDKEIKQIESLLTDRGKGANIGVLREIAKVGNIEKYLLNQGFNEQDALDMGYDTWNDFVLAMKENYDTGIASFEKIQDQMSRLDLNFYDLSDSLTADLAQGFVDKIGLAFASAGEAKANDFLTSFDSITKYLNTDQIQTFTQYLTDIDWSNSEEILEFSEQLEALKWNIPKDEFDNFIQLVESIGRSVKKVDLEKIAQQVTGLQSLSRDLKSGDKDHIFSSEEYELLKEVIPELKDQFVKNLDGDYIYLGSSIQNLINALNKNTDAILNESSERISALVNSGEILEKLDLEKLSKSINEGETDETRGFIADFIKSAKETGLDLSKLGIEGLPDSEEKLKFLTNDQILEIGKKLLSVGIDKDKYEQQLKIINEENKITGSLNKNPHEILEQPEQGKTYEDMGINTYIKDIQSYAKHFGLDPTQYQTSGELEQAVWNSQFDWWENFGLANQAFQKTEEGYKLNPNLTETDLAKVFSIYGEGNNLTGEQARQKFLNGELSGSDILKWYELEDQNREYNPEIGKNIFDLSKGTEGIAPSEDEAKTLRAMAKEYGVSAAEIDKFNKALETGTEIEKGMAAETLANVISQKKAEKQYSKVVKQLDEVNQQYKNTEEDMQGYTEGIYAYGEALSLDMSYGENFAFVADNLDLIRQAAEGNVQSLFELQQALAADHGLVITADGNFDLYNNEVDFANQRTQDFIQSQLEAGAYRWVTVEAESEVEYLVADGAGGFTTQTFTQGTVIRTIQPADADSLSRSASSAGGGGGGGGGGSEKWENPYDKYHDTLEEINDLLRERERLERRYQRLINQGTATAEKLARISKENIQTQRDEIAKQEYLITGREAQIENQIKANPEMKEYIYTEVDQFGDQTIRINWEKINAISDTEEGEEVTAFYEKIDEWLESIYEAQEAILEAEDAIWEELQSGKDEYLDLEEQVKDALIDQYQKEIDNLSAINDTINDTNTQLIESMQNSVDKYRQDRDNERTEQELSDKQRRLAYLQQDTSGANALEIMNLQKEIEQGQEDYTDTLVDQKISELQDQNEKAAEQRQRQIDIMQQQLDKYVESGEIWKQVEELISAGTSNTKNLITGSELETLLKNSGGFEGMSKIQQMDWLQSTNVLISQALKWLSDGAVSTFSTGKEVTFTTSDGKTVTGVANAQGEIEAKGQIYKDVAMDAYGNYSTKETIKDAKSEYNKREEEKRKAKEEANQQAKFPYGIVPSQIGRILYNGTSGTDVKALQDALNQLGYNSGDVDGNYGPATAQAVRRFQSAMGLPADGDFGPQTKEKMRLKGYKTGGLADFTGPAWLDGTTARPEYVLNADQTKAFFSLVDVLGSLRSGVSKTTQNSGDSNYDIDINVESIGSDYDVEQLATTVKRLINEDARYRNNNTINLMR